MPTPQPQQCSLIESPHLVDWLGVGQQLQHTVDLCFGELSSHRDGQQL
jgi:hypothetical protein